VPKKDLTKSKSYILALLYSNTTFCATFIKLYLTLIAQIEGIKVELANKLSKEPVPLLVKHRRGQLRKNLNIIIFLQEDD
jgi:hypothetical protein